MGERGNIGRLRAELEQVREQLDGAAFLHEVQAAEIERLRELVLDLTQQGVHVDSTGRVDSCAISTYADALRYLAECGVFTIEIEHGRRVFGRWVTGV